MLFRSRTLAFYPNRFDLESISTEGHRHRREQEPLVSGVEKNNMAREDSIVYLALLLHGGSVDLGARSLVSGVGCNVPGFFPKLEFVFFFHHHDIIMFSCICGFTNFQN